MYIICHHAYHIIHIRHAYHIIRHAYHIYLPIRTHIYSHYIFFHFYIAQHSRLLVFVVILALSNLGTSFASAILAKDTTTNSESGSPELVDKKTGEVVATNQSVKRFTADELKLDQLNSRGLIATSLFGVTTSDFSSMPAGDAKALLGDCEQGNKVVKLTYNTWRARTVCGSDWTCQSIFTFPQNVKGNPDPISGVLCLQGTSPMEYVHVTPDPNDSNNYLISSSEPDFLTSDVVSFGCLLTMFFVRHRLYIYLMHII